MRLAENRRVRYVGIVGMLAIHKPGMYSRLNPRICLGRFYGVFGDLVSDGRVPESANTEVGLSARTPGIVSPTVAIGGFLSCGNSRPVCPAGLAFSFRGTGDLGMHS